MAVGERSAFRLLLLILQFPPDVNSTGRLMERLGDGLIARGGQVGVLTSFPHYARFRVWDEYRGRLVERARHRGMDVTRVAVMASGNKKRMLDRLWSYLSFNVLALLFGLLDRRPYSIVLATNGSFFSGLTAAILARVRGVPSVYNVQDLYPETPVQAGQLTNRRAIAVLERIERLMYRLAGHIVVITPSFKENIVAKGIAPDKVSVIPNFVDVEEIRPLEKVNAFSQRHGLADAFVVTHAGNIGFVYDLRTLLDAAALLADEPAIRVLIVGDGVVKADLEREARERGLANVVFLPYQPDEVVPLMRATSDVQVALYRRGSARYSMPSKVYEIMASGRALLASAEEGSDVWRLVTETGCGICVPPEDARALANAILRLYRDPAFRASCGERGREVAVRQYSQSAVVAQYDALLRRLARGRARVSALRGAASAVPLGSQADRD